ncbi:pyridoxal phosphate-dependent aminotransferase [Candidatus Cyanaurora vandensis]|uniref:pyridoxal phosphate-dependent aminotransferase n=1 Tax=Candidatus Cyanaurora vandensis TaxID=2714958 RepID=UPI00257AE2D7|nr:pyridoxal phosphate-dependent aminotransferase [Candidatus Cyanaurora vandensis]
MFAPQQYLTWLIPYYGRIRYDLATSSAASPDLARLLPLPALDDYNALNTLKETLAHHYALPTTDVQLTLGTSQALFITLAHLLKPGDRVLVEHPTYEPLWAVPQALGARVEFLQRGNDWDLTAKQLAPWTGQGVRALVLSDPHNPSGAVLTTAQILELARWCEAEGAWLVVDEVYQDFLSPQLTTHRHLHPRIIALSSLTKVYGLGALRCGWLFAPPEIVQGTEAVLRYLNGSNPPACAALGLAALAHREYFWQLSQTRARTNFQLVEQWLAQQPNLTWQAPKQGVFGFVRAERDLRPVLEQGCADHGVLAVPGVFFGEPHGFRLSWGADPEVVQTGLQLLSQVLAK